jgi:hypothetical protein
MGFRESHRDGKTTPTRATPRTAERSREGERPPGVPTALESSATA